MGAVIRALPTPLSINSIDFTKKSNDSSVVIFGSNT